VVSLSRDAASNGADLDSRSPFLRQVKRRRARLINPSDKFPRGVARPGPKRRCKRSRGVGPWLPRRKSRQPMSCWGAGPASERINERGPFPLGAGLPGLRAARGKRRLTPSRSFDAATSLAPPSRRPFKCASECACQGRTLSPGLVSLPPLPRLCRQAYRLGQGTTRVALRDDVRPISRCLRPRRAGHPLR
jgi:hypothetical protein